MDATSSLSLNPRETQISDTTPISQTSPATNSSLEANPPADDQKKKEEEFVKKVEDFSQRLQNPSSQVRKEALEEMLSSPKFLHDFWDGLHDFWSIFGGDGSPKPKNPDRSTNSGSDNDPKDQFGKAVLAPMLSSHDEKEVNTALTFINTVDLRGMYLSREIANLLKKDSQTPLGLKNQALALEYFQINGFYSFRYDKEIRQIVRSKTKADQPEELQRTAKSALRKARSLNRWLHSFFDSRVGYGIGAFNIRAHGGSGNSFHLANSVRANLGYGYVLRDKISAHTYLKASFAYGYDRLWRKLPSGQEISKSTADIHSVQGQFEMGLSNDLVGGSIYTGVGPAFFLSGHDRRTPGFALSGIEGGAINSEQSLTMLRWTSGINLTLGYSGLFNAGYEFNLDQGFSSSTVDHGDQQYQLQNMGHKVMLKLDPVLLWNTIASVG